MDRLPSGKIPDFCCAITTHRNDALPMWFPGHTRYCIAMPGIEHGSLAGPGVKNMGGLIGAGGYNILSIGREGSVEDGACMTFVGKLMMVILVLVGLNWLGVCIIDWIA